jgi:hypothetical protein
MKGSQEQIWFLKLVKMILLSFTKEEEELRLNIYFVEN